MSCGARRRRRSRPRARPYAPDAPHPRAPGERSDPPLRDGRPSCPQHRRRTPGAGFSPLRQPRAPSASSCSPPPGTPRPLRPPSTSPTPASGIQPDTTGIRPFHVNVPDAALVDLRRRIAATRWPDRETVDDQSQGAQLAKLQELVRYWGTGYDWRKAEAKLNALPQFMTTIDGRRHSLHPRPLSSPECAAGDHHARLAGLGVRAAQDHRSAHRSDRARRPRRGRLRRRHPVDAGLRLLRQADGHRLGPRPHRASLGGADEAPRVHPLRRPGRRLGRPHLQRDGAPGAGGIARHPHQLAGDGTARGGRGARRRRARAGGTLREGTRGVRRAHDATARRGTRPTSR